MRDAGPTTVNQESGAEISATFQTSFFGSGRVITFRTSKNSPAPSVRGPATGGSATANPARTSIPTIAEVVYTR